MPMEQFNSSCGSCHIEVVERTPSARHTHRGALFRANDNNPQSSSLPSIETNRETLLPNRKCCRNPPPNLLARNTCTNIKPAKQSHPTNRSIQNQMNRTKQGQVRTQPNGRTRMVQGRASQSRLPAGTYTSKPAGQGRAHFGARIRGRG